MIHVGARRLLEHESERLRFAPRNDIERREDAEGHDDEHQQRTDAPLEEESPDSRPGGLYRACAERST